MDIHHGIGGNTKAGLLELFSLEGKTCACTHSSGGFISRHHNDGAYGTVLGEKTCGVAAVYILA